MGTVLFASYAVGIAPRRRLLRFLRIVSSLVSRPIKLLFLADLHLRGRSSAELGDLARLTRRASSSGAQAVLLGGDIIEFDDEAPTLIPRLRESLGDFRALCVLGNHEIEGGIRSFSNRFKGHANDPELIRDSLRKSAIEPIDRRAVELGGLQFVGLPWRRRPGTTRELVDLVSNSERPSVVLTHSPDQVWGLEPSRVVLALCGHTHGGQIRLPLIGAKPFFLQRPIEAPSGLIEVAGVATYVTTGWSQTIPIRFGVFPEAVLIELVPAQGLSSAGPLPRKYELLR